MRNRFGAAPAIAPVYAVRAQQFAREIAQVEPELAGERAVVDYLEREILRTEYSLAEDVLDGSDDPRYGQPTRWWCKHHHREAARLGYPYGRSAGLKHCCDPRLGGILLPCDAEEMTENEIAEFEHKSREPRKPDYIARNGLLVPNDA
jgi:hypothetical protein